MSGPGNGSNISFDVRGDAEAKATLKALGRDAQKALVAGINRTARDLSSRIAKRTSEVYNLSSRVVRQYVTGTRASRTNPNAAVVLRVRAIPIELFKPRVKMQAFTYTWRGKTITRRLPAIFLQRLRGMPAHYVAPAFPLQQRRTGALRAGEKVRRRIDSRRDRLTRLRYYTFPKKFIDETLIPEARQFVPPHVLTELRRALRRYTKAGGARTLVGNQA